jgi:hypothetical protein
MGVDRDVLTRSFTTGVHMRPRCRRSPSFGEKVIAEQGYKVANIAHTAGVRTTTMFVILILLMAILLRTLPLPGEAFEGDEVFSHTMATLPLGDAIQAIRKDMVHPPLYYLLVRGVTTVAGSSDTAVRAISLLSGLLVIALTGCIGLLVPRLLVPALGAAALVTLSDAHIFYSQQARSYAFYSLLVAVMLALWCLPEMVRRRRSYWFAVALLSGVLLYTHYFGAVYMGVLLMVIFFSGVSRAEKLRWTACFVGAGIIFAPWAWAVQQSYRAKQGLDANLGWETPASLYSLRETFGRFSGIPDIPGGTALSFLVGILLASAALYSVLRKRLPSDEARFVIACGALAIGPPVILWALAMPPLQLPVSGFRHLMPSLMPWVVLSCIGLWFIARSSSKQSAVLITGFAGLLVLQLVPTTHFMRYRHRIPYDRVAQDIEKLAPVPLFTTYQYGVGEPVNHYIHGDRRVLPLADAEQLPGSFVLLYRPVKSSDRNIVTSLAVRGWRTRRISYYSSDPSNLYGTEVAWFEKEAR